MTPTRRLKAIRCGALVATASAFLLLAGSAYADTPITSYSAVPSTTQAGGHPDVEVQFAVSNRFVQQSKTACDCEDAKNAAVHLPAGFIGNPHATPQCTIAQFSSDTCPIDSQVGIVNVLTSEGGLPFDAALYNLDPPPDVSGLLGFKIFLFDTPQFTVLSARTGSDYGLDATATSIYHGAYPLQTYQEDLWGVPADPSHDPLRLEESQVPGDAPSYIGNLCDENGALSTVDPTTIVKPCETNFTGLTPVHSNSPLTPFLQNPTSCESELSSTLDVLSYDGGTSEAAYTWPQMTGCDQLSFDPSLYAQPTTTDTDTASGIDVNLSVPQELSPTIPSPTELREAIVTLPPGFSINPNAADGKTACADAEARFGTEEEAQCPEFAKVGSLEIESSALPAPIPGSVYLGRPLPGNRYRIFLVANGFATHIKLAGTVSADSVTGQLAITFKELPQSPLTAFDMHFFGSERGLLATPTKCGTYPVTTTFTPWDETIGTQTSTQYFTLSSGPNGTPCPGTTRPFDPGFEAASAGNTSGAHSPFAIELARNDGNQNLRGLTVTTPPGFAATLSGIPYCSDAAIAAASAVGYTGLEEELNPSCPSSSQVGTSLVGAGAGNHPLYVGGKVYLAGPYKGAPLSLVVITPAISGPYDLGNVVVRAALKVNPETVQVTAVSDPLPQIIEGIPLRLRSIRVDLNRKNFTLDPTNCDPFSVSAAATGDEGGQANPTFPYQMANCSVLPFAPKLSMRLGGSTRRAGNPSLRADLSYPSGGPYANVSRVAVTLPPTEFVDNSHINNPCTKVQFFEGRSPGEKCPPGSEIGHARVKTPLLEKPLEGPVYLRTGGGHKLPDIVAALNGQIDVALDGHVDEVKGGIRTTFEAVPDAPVSQFTLTLAGGRKGLLENNTSLCSHSLHAIAKITGQNGKSANQNPTLQTPCRASRLMRARRFERRGQARAGWRSR
ncbi:MAG: hypothetical protein WB507_01705 [Solirubrobacterales bacterium]